MPEAPGFTFTIESEDSNEPIVIGASGLLIVIAVGVLWCWSCCTCFCGTSKEQVPPAVAGSPAGTIKVVKYGNKDVKVEHLRTQKSFYVALFLWFFGGLVGAHHFYLERLVHGMFTLFTANFCGIGWCVDVCALPTYVFACNRGTSPFAQPSRGLRRSIWLWILLVFIIIFDCICIAKAPRVVHKAGLLDLDARLAGTQPENPYDLFGVPRGTTLTRPEVRVTYEAKVKEIVGDNRRCDDECKQRKQQLDKARDFLTGDWRDKRRQEVAGEERRSRKQQQPKRDRSDPLWEDCEYEWAEVTHMVVELVSAWWKEEGDADTPDDGQESEL
mmetsp:Transcript_13515/g.31800  ORF Transcript_13515/g.31800 Transcript_13515/m.31800 type:complete len:329 (+) Transcript_13515:97-1083(+)